eukprot:5046244-Pyramimonas_sp.AAC.1
MPAPPRQPNCTTEPINKPLKERAGSLADKITTIYKHLRRLKNNDVRLRQAIGALGRILGQRRTNWRHIDMKLGSIG